MSLWRIFSKNQNQWSDRQTDLVKQFLLSHSYTLQLYAPKRFNELISMLVYEQLLTQSDVTLFDKNRPLAAIIALKGQLVIDCRKAKKQAGSPRKSHSGQNYPKTVILTSQGDVFEVGGRQITISTVPNSAMIVGPKAAFLFVPFGVYTSYVQNMMQDRVLQYLPSLRTAFPLASKKEIQKMANQIQPVTLKISSLLYKKGDFPHQVFLLLEGTLKSTNANRAHVISGLRTVGETDMNLAQRQQTITVDSAQATLLRIPKSLFESLSFIQSNTPSNAIQTAPVTPKKLDRHSYGSTNEYRLPPLSSFRTDVTQASQAKLARHSHSLLVVSDVDRQSHRKSSRSVMERSVVDPIEEKVRIYNQFRRHYIQLDFNHRLL